VAGVDGREPEDIPEEGPVRIGVAAVHDHMSTEDHPTNSLFDLRFVR
jgi:hypothetical protein